MSYGLVPALFPAVKSDASHGVDVCRTSDFMVTDDTGFEEESNGIRLAVASVQSEFLQDSAQLGSKLRSNEPVSGGRIDAIG